MGPWAPSVLISEEAGQSWVRGLLLGTRGGVSRSLVEDLSSGPSNVPLYHSWDTDLEGALALGMSGPCDLLCRI